jgi:hypothetical protein
MRPMKATERHFLFIRHRNPPFVAVIGGGYYLVELGQEVTTTALFATRKQEPFCHQVMEIAQSRVLCHAGRRREASRCVQVAAAADG